MEDPGLKMNSGGININHKIAKSKTTEDTDMDLDIPTNETSNEENHMDVDDLVNEPKIATKVPNLEKDLKNKDINHMTRDTAELVYSNYL